MEPIVDDPARSAPDVYEDVVWRDAREEYLREDAIVGVGNAEEAGFSPTVDGEQ
jgi:hypothetical protein